jgi:uncharacterized protein (TIGR00645 family)
LELLIERLILASRWILVVFYVGLAGALALYAISFIRNFVGIAGHAFSDVNESQMILDMLSLIDAALVASLIVMVMISSYENFVGHFDTGSSTGLSWLGKLDSGSLKIKVAASIVAISSIHLLQVFLNIDQYPSEKVAFSIALHLTFIASAVLLGILERIQSHLKP